MNSICRVLFGLLIVLTSSLVMGADSINQKVVTFLKSKVDVRVGGGECAQAASEALRVSGAGFQATDLGQDHPEKGDYVWGTLVKVVSSDEEKPVDSAPAAKVLPGDILQYHDCRFVFVTVSGNSTRTQTITAQHHTSIVAKVDPTGQYPIEVFEQNAPNVQNVETRQVMLSPIDLSGLRAGWIRIYRPKPRRDEPGKYQISIVNNTAETQEATIKFDGSVLSKITLSPANTAASYVLPVFSTQATTKKFSIVLSNRVSMNVSNGSGYEIYDSDKGVLAVRKLKD